MNRSKIDDPPRPLRSTATEATVIVRAPSQSMRCARLATASRREMTRSVAPAKPSGRLMKNTQRHETYLTMSPPAKGPMMPEMPHTAPNAPCTLPRCSMENMSPMMVMEIGPTAPAPRPCTARKATSWMIVPDSPLAIDPARNTAMPKSIGIQKVLIADDKDALGQASGSFFGALDALDDQGPRCSAKELLFAEAMDMRVIPIETGWFIGGYSEAVLERLIAGLDRGFHHVVLMADGRDGEAVEVEVGGDGAHDAAGAGIIGGGGCGFPVMVFMRTCGG